LAEIRRYRAEAWIRPPFCHHGHGARSRVSGVGVSPVSTM